MEDDIEAARLAKLESFGILDTGSEREFDAITWLVRNLLDVPVAAVSLVDRDRQWFKSQQGLSVDETPRDLAYCNHAVHYDDVMVVEDATKDPRFADNPLVAADQNRLMSYAGVPLRPPAPGFADDLPGIGTLCVADTKPRTFTPEQIELLKDLAAMVSMLIRARADAGAALELAKAADAAAREANRRNRQLRQAERLAGIGSWRIDLVTKAVEWSDQVFSIHGLPPGSDMPSFEQALSYYRPEDRERIAADLERAASRGDPFDIENDFITADGSLRRVRSIGECECVDGKPVAVIGVFQDITEIHGREETLRRSAFSDSLTGLANRAAFERRLDESMAIARRDKAPLALLLIDLDGFKGVNDSFGHEAGDEVLKVMAQRMRGEKFAQAYPARLGGDEFVVLVSRPRDCANLEPFIAELLGQLVYSIERDGETRLVSATIGAARLDSDIASAGELMRSADLALYEAKRAQRGTGRIFKAEHCVLPDWSGTPLGTVVSIRRQAKARGAH